MGVVARIAKAFTREKIVDATVLQHESVYAPTLATRDAKELLLRLHTWVYTFANRNAVDVAANTIRVYTRDTSGARKYWGGRPVSMKRRAAMKHNAGSLALKSMAYDDAPLEIADPEHPLVSLLRQPNPWCGGTEFMELLVTWLELCGNGYWHTVTSRATGMPVELWTMGAQYVTVEPDDDPNVFIRGYLYGRQEPRESFAADEVIHFKYPNPNSAYYGMGPLQAVVAEADTSRRITMHSYWTLEQGVQPGLIIKVKAQTDSARKAMEAQLNRKHAGVWKAGKSMVLSGDVDVVQWAMGQKELAFLQSADNLRDVLAAAFGISKSDYTSDDVNRANAEAGGSRQERRSVRPRCKKIEDTLNARLLPAFREALNDPHLYVCFDSPEQEAEKDAVARVVSLRGAALLTVNECRAEMGYEPVPGGDELAKPDTGTDQDPGGDEDDDKPDESDEPRKEDKATDGHPAWAKHWHGERKALIEAETALADALRPAYDAAVREAAEQLADGSGPVTLFDFRAAVREALERELGKVFAAAIVPAARGAFDVPPVSQLNFLRHYTVRLANEITANTEAAIRASIAQGIGSGETVPQIQERVREAIGEEAGFRAERIARTEVAYVQGEGERRGSMAAGFTKKTWDLSPMPCPMCEAIKAKYPGEIPIGQPFARIGDTVMGTDGKPYQVTFRELQGPPAHPQCYCAALYGE